MSTTKRNFNFTTYEDDGGIINKPSAKRMAVGTYNADDSEIRHAIASPRNKLRPLVSVEKKYAEDVTEKEDVMNDVSSPRKAKKKVSGSKGRANYIFHNLKQAVFQTRMKKLNEQFKEHLNSELVRIKGEDSDKSFEPCLKSYLMTKREWENVLVRKPGDVYTFGTGDCFQLGHGPADAKNEDEAFLDDRYTTIAKPRLLQSLKTHPIISIACGGMHNVVVTSTGDVYTWGNNDDKALGREGPDWLDFVPKKVDALNFDERKDGIVMVSAGDTQTLALTLRGNVYMWGCYKEDGKNFRDAKSGLKNVKGHHVHPVKNEFLSDVSQIACGDAISVALTHSGEVFTWGVESAEGMLGRKVPSMKKNKTEFDEGEERYDLETVRNCHVTPHPIDWFGGAGNKRFVRYIACGAFHILAIAASEGKGKAGNAVYVAGRNNYGQLGLGDLDHRVGLTRIEKLDGLDIIGCDGGQFHSVCHSRSQVFTFGRSCSGQLGTSDEMPNPGSFINEPQMVEFPSGIKGVDVDSVSAGSCHTMALFKNGRAYSWGFGESAQLGNGKELNETRPTLIKMDYDRIKILKLSGGGQHSGVICDSR
mmetsp:Transcript_12797/g.16721  ORF Transcript_12797/g.16721 Transcript_12797/m.16721 type:complete len:590 (-) Transcript_12797:43-1812(-)